MKPLFVFLSVFILLGGLLFSGYMIGKQNGYFLTNNQLLQRIVEKNSDLNSFNLDLTGSSNDGMGGNVVLNFVKAGESNPLALDLVVKMKQEGMEMDFLSFVTKNKEYFLKIGEIPMLAFFGLEPFMGKWFSAEAGDIDKIKDVLTDEMTMVDNQGGDMISSFSSYKENLTDLGSKINEIKDLQSFALDYILNKKLFIINEKLADTELEGKMISNYSLTLDKVVLKEFIINFFDKIAEISGEEKYSSTEEDLLELDKKIAEFDISNIKVAIEKRSFILRNFSFDLKNEAQKISLDFALNELNLLNLNSIEEPEAVSVVEWVKFYIAEGKRETLYTTREESILSLRDVLDNQCKSFTAAEAADESEEVENRVLKIDGSNLSLINQLEKFDDFDFSMIHDPEIPEGEVLEACSPNSTELCDFAFGNPEKKGEAFDFDMTYVDPCNYWVNFYSESDLKGYLNDEEVMFPKYVPRTYEQYLNGQLPETELYNGEKESFSMGGNMSFDMGTGTEGDNSDVVELEPYDPDQFDEWANEIE